MAAGKPRRQDGAQQIEELHGHEVCQPDSILAGLAKEGRISIIPRGTQGANQALIVLKPG